MSVAQTTMSKFHHLQTFVNERLTAAAEEIFGVFEKTIVAYEEEMTRQLRLLDVVRKPALASQRTESPQHRLCPEERISHVEQGLQETSHIKVEQEELLDEDRAFIKQEDYFSNCEPLEEWPLVLDCEQNESEADKDATTQRLCLESDFGSSEPNSNHAVLFCGYYPENNQDEITDNVASTSARNIKSEHHDWDLENTAIHCQVQLFEQPFHRSTFHTDSDLYTRVEMRALSTEKPFICNICGKGFGFKRYLAQHMITHSAEKPYACNRCRKTFRRQQALQIHMRCHTGEKPYFCKTCGKRFCQSSALRVHLRVHTGEKPYTCNMCGTEFRSLPVLRNHIKRSHESKML